MHDSSELQRQACVVSRMSAPRTNMQSEGMPFKEDSNLQRSESCFVFPVQIATYHSCLGGNRKHERNIPTWALVFLLHFGLFLGSLLSCYILGLPCLGGPMKVPLIGRLLIASQPRKELQALQSKQKSRNIEILQAQIWNRRNTGMNHPASMFQHRCVHIYIYVCMYVCMHVCMYVCM